MAFKSEDGAATRKVLLTLDETTVATFKEAGEGNMSLGARRVAEAYRRPAEVQSVANSPATLRSTARPNVVQPPADEAVFRFDENNATLRVGTRRYECITPQSFLDRARQKDKVQGNYLFMQKRMIEYEAYLQEIRQKHKLSQKEMLRLRDLVGADAEPK